MQKEKEYNWLQRAQITNATARRKGHSSEVTAEGVKAAWERCKGFCFYCGLPIRLGKKTNRTRLATIEHVKSLGTGGTNTDDNIEFACKECNNERA